MNLETNRARKRARKQGAAKTRRELASLPVVEPRRWLRPVTPDQWDADVDEILRVLWAIRSLPQA